MAGTTLDRWPQSVSGLMPKMTGNGTDQVFYQQQAIPINRIPGMGNSIIEITAIDFYCTGFDVNANGSNCQLGVALRSGTLSGLSATNQLPLQIQDSHVLYYWQNNGWYKQITAVGIRSMYEQITVHADLQTVDGFGVLVATDNITWCMWMNATNDLQVQLFWRVWYRYVNVGLDEFIGLLQSQT